MSILKRLGIKLTLNIEEDDIPELKDKEMEPSKINNQVSFAKLLQLELVNGIVCFQTVDGNSIALTDIYNFKFLYSSRNSAALPSIISPKQSSSNDPSLSFDFIDAIEHQHLSSVPYEINKYDLIGILETDLTISFGLVVNSDSDGVYVYKIQVDSFPFSDVTGAIRELKTKSNTLMYIIDKSGYNTFSNIYPDITKYDFNPRDHRKITNYILFNVSMLSMNDHQQLDLFVKFVNDLSEKHSDLIVNPEQYSFNPEQYVKSEKEDNSLVIDEIDNNYDDDAEPSNISFEDEELKEERNITTIESSNDLSPSISTIMNTEELEEEHTIHVPMNIYMRKQASYIERNIIPGGEISLNRFVDLQDDSGDFKSPKTLRNELQVIGAYIKRKEKDEFNRVAAMRNIALLDFALLQVEQRYNKLNNDEDK